MVAVFGSPLVQAGVLALLSGVALWSGRLLYERAHERHEDIAKKIEGRKRPLLRWVLYEIFWLPVILFAMVGFVRLGTMALPGTFLTDTAMFVLDRLFILVFVVVSINVIREVIQSAGEEELLPEEKEG